MPNPFAQVQTEFSKLPAPSAPMFATTADDVLTHIKPVSGQPLTFRTRGIGRPQDVTLIPFYELHRQRYSIYWQLISESDWKAHAAEIADDDARRMAEAARVVDDVRPGESQSETDHKLQSENSRTGDYFGRKWRDAAGWFSYEVKILPAQPQELVATFWGGDNGAREFDVIVDGKIIATQKLENQKPGEFLDVIFPLPPELIQYKQEVTVKFAAHPGNVAGGLFGLSVRRANPN
jgi:uncharacterized protein